MLTTTSTIVTPVTSTQVEDFINQFGVVVHISYSTTGKGHLVNKDIKVEDLSLSVFDGLPVGASVHIVIPTWRGIAKKLWIKATHGWMEHPLTRKFSAESNIMHSS